MTNFHKHLSNGSVAAAFAIVGDMPPGAQRDEMAEQLAKSTDALIKRKLALWLDDPAMLLVVLPWAAEMEPETKRGVCRAVYELLVVRGTIQAFTSQESADLTDQQVYDFLIWSLFWPDEVHELAKAETKKQLSEWGIPTSAMYDGTLPMWADVIAHGSGREEKSVFKAIARFRGGLV